LDNAEVNTKQQDDFDTGFMQLDEPEGNTGRIEPILYDVERVRDFPKELVNNKKADGKNSYSVWSQEPTLVAMRNEITTLRGMLEQQLSGLAWGELQRKNPVRAKLIRQLLELGFGPEFIDQMMEPVDESQDFTEAWQAVLTRIAGQLPVRDDDLVMAGGVVALVGSTGVGKTTTLAKLAARYALRHGRSNIALITTDTYRIGAMEQLRTYARILGIPVKIAHNKKQLMELLKLLSDKKFVLIDTAGMGQRDVRLMEQFSVINDSAPNLKSLLVMSTATHRAALDEVARVFSNVDIHGCILTKLDETTSLGGALSVVCEHRIPVSYISDGQRVPEDLHLARAHTLLNRAVMTARRCRQPLDDDSVELAFSRMASHASA
jgi:flagellar biosynthesis protein FlhF